MGKEFAYIKIMKYYEELILKGDLKSDEMLPSEEEISQKFSVSRITTKRALEELCKKGLIYRVRGKGSFITNTAAVKSLPRIKEKKERKSNIVALIVPFANSFGKSLDMFHSICMILEQSNLALSFYISQYSVEKEREIIQRLLNEGVAGIILYPVSNTDNIDLMYQVYLKKVPFVVVDKYYEGIPLDGVFTDNLSGGYMAATHLLEAGHKGIVFIADDKLNAASSIRDRYFGFCNALNNYSIPINNKQLVIMEGLCNVESEILINYTSSGKEVLDPFKSILEEILNLSYPVTAIQAVNDYVGILFMKAALQLGIKVPNELSIIGFDNIENGSYVEVPLTTIEQNFLEIGREAARLVIDKINNAEKVSRKIYIPAKLILRSSTTIIGT